MEKTVHIGGEALGWSCKGCFEFGILVLAVLLQNPIVVGFTAQREEKMSAMAIHDMQLVEV